MSVTMQFKLKLESMRSGKYVNGVEVPLTPLEIGPDVHVKDLLKMKIRDDDVLVAAYPKCGTHWLWEVVHMLLNKTTDHESRTKEHAMMEFCPVSFMDSQDSPRILNSHLYFAHLPEEILTKKTKIFHVVRNPKDVMVSMYYHFRIFLEDLTWENLLEEIMTNAGNIEPLFSFLRQMNQFQKDHPDHPVKLIYYEDMKRNPVKAVHELAAFLDQPVTDEFCREVARACDFDTMKKANDNKDAPNHLLDKLKEELGQMYRKGVVGDWKRHFTVAQNEAFDVYVQKEMKDLPFTFTYE